MLALEFDRSCPECSKRLIDVDDEFVCQSCGLTQQKEVLVGSRTPLAAIPLGGNALGSFMGTKEITQRERHTRGITGRNTNYEYLKVVSDFAGKREGAPVSCARMIERVGEKLSLPRVVLQEAASISRKVLSSVGESRRLTVSEVSAYSLIAACKVEGITSVSVGEIMGAHAALGRRVASSSIIRLGLDSPFKILPRTPEDYLNRVLARLSMNGRLSDALSKEGASQTNYFASIRETARELLLVAGRESWAGRRPCALASSAVYSAEIVESRLEARKKRFTQRDVAECGDTAEYTIREQCATVLSAAVDTVLSRRLRAPLIEDSR